MVAFAVRRLTRSRLRHFAVAVADPVRLRDRADRGGQSCRPQAPCSEHGIGMCWLAWSVAPWTPITCGRIGTRRCAWRCRSAPAMRPRRHAAQAGRLAAAERAGRCSAKNRPLGTQPIHAQLAAQRRAAPACQRRAEQGQGPQRAGAGGLLSLPRQVATARSRTRPFAHRG